MRYRKFWRVLSVVGALFMATPAAHLASSKASSLKLWRSKRPWRAMRVRLRLSHDLNFIVRARLFIHMGEDCQRGMVEAKMSQCSGDPWKYWKSPSPKPQGSLPVLTQSGTVQIVLWQTLPQKKLDGESVVPKRETLTRACEPTRGGTSMLLDSLQTCRAVMMWSSDISFSCLPFHQGSANSSRDRILYVY